MSSKVTAALVAAMHTSQGCKAHGAADWLALAQTHEALGKAFGAVFGRQLPHCTAFGKWLRSNEGKEFDALRLIAVYSARGKAYRYAVETPAETSHREHAAELRELKQSVISDDQLVRSSKRLFKAVAEEEEKKRDAAIPVPECTFTVQEVPAAEYETTTKVDRDGRVTHEPVIGRDGMPLKKHPTPAATPPAPVIVPRTNLPPSHLPVWTREGRRPTRAELAAAHRGERAAPVPIPTPIWVTEKRHPEPVELAQWQRAVREIKAEQPTTIWDLERQGNGVDFARSTTGIRQGSGGKTTGWDGTLKGL